MTVSCENADLYVYMITGDSDLDIVKQFRGIIGRSYIAPKFAFGYGQSRWGYKTEDDFRTVVKNTAKTMCRSIWFTWILTTCRITRTSP